MRKEIAFKLPLGVTPTIYAKLKDELTSVGIEITIAILADKQINVVVVIKAATENALLEEAMIAGYLIGQSLMAIKS